MFSSSSAVPRSRDRRTRRVFILAFGLLLTAAPTAAPQAPLELRARAIFAAQLPGEELANAPLLSSSTNVVSYAEIPAMAAVGLGLGLRPRELPVELRLAVTRAFTGREVGVWGCADPSGSPLPCPAIFIEVPTDVRATVGTADVAGSASLGPLVVRPILGVSWLRQTYEWDPTPVGSFSLAPGQKSTDAVALHYGLGLVVPFGRPEVEVEVTDHRSGSSRLRADHAVVARVGVSLPLT